MNVVKELSGCIAFHKSQVHFFYSFHGWGKKNRLTPVIRLDSKNQNRLNFTLEDSAGEVIYILSLYNCKAET
jgi:hypothetical protein